jgi:hypothetical protein
MDPYEETLFAKGTGLNFYDILNLTAEDIDRRESSKNK